MALSVPNVAFASNTGLHSLLFGDCRERVASWNTYSNGRSDLSPSLAGLTGHASMAERKPGLQLLSRLEATWSLLTAILMDETSLADPELIVV